MDEPALLQRIDETTPHLDALTLARFPLTSLLSKLGFHDGDALLDRRADGEYGRDLFRRCADALAEAGLKPTIDFLETIHNPLRFVFFEERGDGLERLAVRTTGERVGPEALDAILSSHQVEIWAYALGDALDELTLLRSE